jgi:two-component system, sensor histidine kinase and response regulator
MGTPKPLSEAQPQRVLVAEDELIAQRVAKRCLEAMGYTVIVVSDGVAAVNAWSQHELDLVLMDLQMEPMDGLQAALEIRRQERPGRRVPIFGLSASAVRDDLANCTAAGMDGLLIKPLHRVRLHQALVEFGLPRPAPRLTGAVIHSHGESVERPADLVSLRAKFGGDTHFVHRLCQAFLSSVKPLLSELGRAAEAGERTLLRGLAHKIKGAGTNIHAQRFALLAAKIESESMSMPLAELRPAVDALGRAFDDVATHISSESR